MRQKERLEDGDRRWRSIEEDREIDLGDYQVIREAGDWTKGAEKALSTILERIEASEEAVERAERFMERVNNKQAEFSGKSRVCVTAAVVYFALKGTIDQKELAKQASISIASLRNTIEQMSNTIDLN